MGWLKEKWHKFWDWVSSLKDEFVDWWDKPSGLVAKSIDVVVWVGGKAIKGALVVWFMTWAGASIEIVAGVILATLPRVRDKTWNVILGLLAFTVTLVLYYWVFELYCVLVGGWLWSIFTEGYRVARDTFREKGFWLGLPYVLWREIGVVLGPLFGSFIKKGVHAAVRVTRPWHPSFVVRWRNRKEVRAPGLKPHRSEEMRNAAKRPIKGRKKPLSRVYKKYDGENLPLSVEMEKMEVGRRYVVPYSIERHHADKAGDHIDFSLRGPFSGMVHRWQLADSDDFLPRFEKGKPVRVSGRKTDGKHGHRVMKNPEVIPEGQYGAGTTEVVDEGLATVWVSGHGNIHILLNNGRAMAIIDPQWEFAEWEFLFVPMKDSPEGGKTESFYRERPMRFKDMSRYPERITELMDEGGFVERKYDGALVWVERTKDGDRVRVVSNRGIDRSHWVPGLRDLDREVLPPDSILLAEVVPRDRFKGPHHTQTARVFNSNPGRAAAIQAEEGELIAKVIRVQRYDGKDRNELFEDTLEERKFREGLKVKSGGVLHVPQIAKTPKGAVRLYDRLLEEGHEGIIYRSVDLDAPEVKFKSKQEYELTPIGIYRGEGKYKDAAGGILYEAGEGEGRVGTGFTDEQRFQLWDHPETLLGEGNVCSDGPDRYMVCSKSDLDAWIEVSGVGQSESGVVRAPSLLRVR